MNIDFYRPTTFLRSLGAFLCAATLLAASGCSEDVTPEENNSGSSCPVGEIENPITGVCQPSGPANNQTSGNNATTCPGGGVVNPVTGMCPPVSTRQRVGVANAAIWISGLSPRTITALVSLRLK